MKRICGKCGARIENRKPDPCIGEYLPGIAFCCCGHDNLKQAYCVGWPNCVPNGGPYNIHKDEKGYFDFRGQAALDYMENLINERR
jgi:hypothetical protein